MTNDLLIAVPLFVFMGVMLERSRIAEELLTTMGLLLGSMRAGLGIAVTCVGALLAASTGIVGATVVTMGLLSLPTMLKRGYEPAIACGSICAAGTLGQIIPPSIVLILLGDQISAAYQQAQLAQGNFSPEAVTVTDLFVGALLARACPRGGCTSCGSTSTGSIKPDAMPSIPKSERAAGLGGRTPRPSAAGAGTAAAVDRRGARIDLGRPGHTVRIGRCRRRRCDAARGPSTAVQSRDPE